MKQYLLLKMIQDSLNTIFKNQFPIVYFGFRRMFLIYNHVTADTAEKIKHHSRQENYILG